MPGGQDTRGWRAIRERFTGRIAGRVADLPPIALVGDDGWAWVLPRRAVDDAAVVLQAPTST